MMCIKTHVSPIIYISIYLHKTPLTRHAMPLNHASGFHGSHLDALPAIQLGPHIEIKRQLPICRAVPPGVEVYYVFDLFAAAVDDPVVPVEGRLVAQQGVEAGLG